MKRRRALSLIQRNLAGLPRSELRRVTLPEKLAHPRLFSLGGSYLVRKSVKNVSGHTAILTVTRYKDIQIGVPHGKAAAQRKAGELAYKTPKAAAQAHKQIEKLGKHKEQLAFPAYQGIPQHEIVYIRTAALRRLIISRASICGACTFTATRRHTPNIPAMGADSTNFGE
jgi:hypothetical protein